MLLNTRPNFRLSTFCCDPARFALNCLSAMKDRVYPRKIAKRFLSDFSAGFPPLLCRGRDLDWPLLPKSPSFTASKFQSTKMSLADEERKFASPSQAWIHR